ncbi:hypothetical protein DIPPA_15391 [Diplonema papillatum]|nr:hypothetical protein DIPPA_15391 [Diplonema papillatum]
MAAPADLAGRSESNRELLEKLIKSTASIIKDQRRWFSADGIGGTPSPGDHRLSRSPGPAPLAMAPVSLDMIRNHAAWAAQDLTASRSISRRPPDRSIASPPTPLLEGLRRERSPPRRPVSPGMAMPSMLSTPVWPRPLSPASPELAPPRAASPASNFRLHPGGGLATTPVLLPQRRKTHRLQERLSRSTASLARARCFIKWLAFTVGRNAGRGHLKGPQHLHELLRIAQADADAARARMEAAEVRANMVGMPPDATRTRLAEVQADCNRRVQLAEAAAGDARAAADDIRAELERTRFERQWAAAAAPRTPGGAAAGQQQQQQQQHHLAEAHAQLQEAARQRAFLQQEVAELRAAEHQRGAENALLREELTAERLRAQAEVSAARAESSARTQTLMAEIDARKEDLKLASSHKNDLESIRSSRLQETVSLLKAEYNGSVQAEALLREQLEARFRELEAMHNEVNILRTDNARLHERVQSFELRSIAGPPGVDLALKDAHVHTALKRLEEQLHDRTAACAAAEAKLLANATHIIKAESELEVRGHRLNMLEEELARQQRVIDDLFLQLTAMRAEKDAMLKGTVDDRALAAAAEAVKLAASEKAELLAQHLEQAKAETIDSRVQLTELRAQLASTLARLEGREDAILVLKDELIRAREQLAASEQAVVRKVGEPRDGAAEKQKLIDHLEGRLRDMANALDAKDKELADLRRQLEEMKLQNARNAGERDLAARNAKDKDDELDRLRRRIAELEARPTRDDLDKLQRLLDDANKALADRCAQVEALTDELHNQLGLSRNLGRTSDGTQAKLLETQAELAHQRVRTTEADERLRAVAEFYSRAVRAATGKCRNFKRKLAECLAAKNAQRELWRRWCALAYGRGKMQQRIVDLRRAVSDANTQANQGQGDLAEAHRKELDDARAERDKTLAEAEAKHAEEVSDLRARHAKELADLRAQLEAQAKRIGALERKLKRTQKRAAELLERHNKLKLLLRYRQKLGRNALGRALVSRKVVAKRACETLMRLNRARQMFKRFITWMGFVLREKKKPAPVRSTKKWKQSVAAALLKASRLGLLAKYHMLWQRWRIRRLARLQLRSLATRNLNVRRRKAMLRLLCNLLGRTPRPISRRSSRFGSIEDEPQFVPVGRGDDEGDWFRAGWARPADTQARPERVVEYRDRDRPLTMLRGRRGTPVAMPTQSSMAEPRRHRFTRYSAARALATRSRHQLLSRYYNKWMAWWQDLRMKSMMLRLQNIEELLVGRDRPAGISEYVAPPRAAKPARGRDGERDSLHRELLETAERARRAELANQEAAGALKLARIAADLRAGGGGGGPPAPRGGGGAEADEAAQRLRVDGLEKTWLTQMLLDALWEARQCWDRRERLCVLLRAELDELHAQNIAFREHLAALQGEREGLVARLFDEAKRAELAELDARASAKDKAQLLAENQGLAQQLEGTAAHLRETKGLLDGIRCERADVVLHADGRFLHLEQQYKALHEQLHARDGNAALELHKLSERSAHDHHRFASLTAELSVRDSTITALEDKLLQTEARLNAVVGELEHVRGELAHCQVESRTREAINAEQRGMQDANLRFELERLERYNQSLKEENDRHRHVVVKELSHMKLEGDLAAGIQSESLVRLQLDRDQLASRLDMLVYMMNAEALTARLELTSVQAQLAAERSGRSRGYMVESPPAGVVALSMASPRKREVLRRLDGEWQHEQELLLSRLEKLATDWKHTLTGPVGVADDCRRLFQQQCDNLAREAGDRRTAPDVFELALHSHTPANSGSSQVEAIRQATERDTLEQGAAHQLATLTREWQAFSSSPSFSMQSAEQREHARIRHSADVQAVRESIDRQRAQMGAAHGASRHAAHVVESLSSLRDPTAARELMELSAAGKEWQLQFCTFVNDLSRLIASNAPPEALAEFNAQIYRVWTRTEGQRRALVEAHARDAAPLETPFMRRPPGHEALLAQPGAGDDVERLAFVVNTRPKILAFVSDSYRMAVNGKRDLQALANAFFQLPVAKLVSPAAVGSLQRVLSQRTSPRRDVSPIGFPRPSDDGAVSRSSTWQQMAAVETRSTALRKKALSSKLAAERSGTPTRLAKDDEAAKAHATQVVEHLEICAAAAAQIETLLSHAITEYMTAAEKSQFGFDGTGDSARQLELRTLDCTSDDRRQLLAASRILFHPRY